MAQPVIVDGIYCLRRQLGKGGMAAVYLADVDLTRFDYTTLYAYTQVQADTHVERRQKAEILARTMRNMTLDLAVIRALIKSAGIPLPGPQVALKVALGAQDQSRFEAEWKNLLCLSHPNVVAVYGGGSHQGRAYYAMELLANLVSLERILALFTIRQKLEIVIQGGRGLQYLHERGLIHRDVKPANLATCEVAPGRFVTKVMDLGLGKTVGEDLGLTLNNQLIGSPYYMSPEQFAASHDVDARADVYSLGAALYEFTTGFRPYHDKTTVLEIASAMAVGEKPVPPPALVPDFPPALAGILAGALAREREARYPSVAEFSADLERYLAEESAAVADAADFAGGQGRLSTAVADAGRYAFERRAPRPGPARTGRARPVLPGKGPRHPTRPTLRDAVGAAGPPAAPTAPTPTAPRRRLLVRVALVAVLLVASGGLGLWQMHTLQVRRAAAALARQEAAAAAAQRQQEERRRREQANRDELLQRLKAKHEAEDRALAEAIARAPAPWFHDFALLGPLTGDPERTWTAIQPATRTGVPDVLAAVRDGDRALMWFRPEQPDETLDFWRLLPPPHWNTHVYALAEIVAAQPTAVEFDTASDRGLAVWCNGRQVFADAQAGAHPNGRVTLDQGRTVLLLRVDQDRDAWNLRFRVVAAGSNGKQPAGVTVQPVANVKKTPLAPPPAGEPAPWFRDFALLGPLTGDPAQTYAALKPAAPAGLPDLAAVVGDGERRVTWVQPTPDADRLDFRRLLPPPHENAHVYAVAEVVADRQTAVQFDTAADDRLTLWLNGRQVAAAHGADPGLTGRVTLDRGRSVLLLRVVQTTGDWTLQCRAVAPDTDGAKPAGVTIKPVAGIKPSPAPAPVAPPPR